MGGILVKLAPHDLIQDPVPSDKLTSLALKGEVCQHQRFLVAVESIYRKQLGKLIEFLEVIFNGFRRRMGGLNRAEWVLDIWMLRNVVRDWSLRNRVIEAMRMLGFEADKSLNIGDWVLLMDCQLSVASRRDRLTDHCFIRLIFVNRLWACWFCNWRLCNIWRDIIRGWSSKGARVAPVGGGVDHILSSPRPSLTVLGLVGVFYNFIQRQTVYCALIGLFSWCLIFIRKERIIVGSDPHRVLRSPDQINAVPTASLCWLTRGVRDLWESFIHVAWVPGQFIFQIYLIVFLGHHL